MGRDQSTTPPIRLDAATYAAVEEAAQRGQVSVDAVIADAIRAYTSLTADRGAERDRLGEHIVQPPLERLAPPVRAAVLVLGRTLRVSWRLRGRGRYSIGAGLITNGRLQLRGPGRIVIGRDVNAWGRSGPNLIETFSDRAVITVGDRVRLNGCGIQAATRIDIGDDAILGTCTIVDTDHHAVEPAERHTGRVRTRPIHIGRNVWVGGAAILKGVSIGDNSVVGLGSVVTEDVPANVVVAGNPARVVRRFRSDAPHSG